ncbi:hypothetical protein [Streptomyces formicae]|uniref:Regulatory protein n=1 Tax=Streptomyces formicae TaxID=1616117 RepID=A0ABY3WTC9_9ACTN|nr:hypothetical protein [Streptomyces formicae]UNM14557.1 hypothetical protein J4032_26585 [Streptomyces formicae]
MDGPADELEGGRGLDLLDLMARTWGVTSVGDHGKWVWFSLASQPDEVA